MNDDSSVLFVSAASIWEITTKSRFGKLVGAEEIAQDATGFLANYQFEPLAISVHHAQVAGLLPGPHKDPFDRMIAAQAMVEQLTVVTNDPAVADLGARTLWDQD